MWRSFFLALGMYLIFLSGELAMVQQVDASWRKPDQAASLVDNGSASQWSVKVSRFLPYTALCLGTVVCIYSFQLPKRLEELKRKG